MDALLKKVTKELENIGDKGLTSSNLETAYKLIDIYKDIKEADYYEKQSRGGDKMYDRGSYNDRYSRSYNGYDSYNTGDERTERYMRKMRDGMDNYNAGRMRYRDGGSNERMVEGIEMTMDAIVCFIENLMDIAETNQEKEIVRKYIEKVRHM